MDRDKIQKYARRLCASREPNSEMEEFLSTAKADGLTIKEAAEVYMYCMNQANDDEFIKKSTYTKRDVVFEVTENLLTEEKSRRVKGLKKA